MTNYSIHRTIGAFYVDADGTLVSGPYDTEEKAKRRIRDLKRADAKVIDDSLTMPRMMLHNPAIPAAITETAREVIAAKLSTATNGGYGKFNTEPREYPGWINPSFNPLRSIRWHGRPRNGYRPAHRAHFLRGVVKLHKLRNAR